MCMKWHGAWLYGVHRTCAETATVSCATSHVSAVSTPLRWIYIYKIKRWKKRGKKAIRSCRITCERSESTRERRIALYESDHQLHVFRPMVFCRLESDILYRVSALCTMSVVFVRWTVATINLEKQKQTLLHEAEQLSKLTTEGPVRRGNNFGHAKIGNYPQTSKPHPDSMSPPCPTTKARVSLDWK